jgi:hypothetical protein
MASSNKASVDSTTCSTESNPSTPARIRVKHILPFASHEILLALPADKPTPTTTSDKAVQSPPKKKSALLSCKRPSSVPSSTGSPVLTP